MPLWTHSYQAHINQVKVSKPLPLGSHFTPVSPATVAGNGTFTEFLGHHGSALPLCPLWAPGLVPSHFPDS